MSTRDSVNERCATWFVEASEKLKREQLMFIHRSLHSSNEVICNVACSSQLWKTLRRTYATFSLCTMKYNDLIVYCPDTLFTFLYLFISISLEVLYLF